MLKSKDNLFIFFYFHHSELARLHASLSDPASQPKFRPYSSTAFVKKKYVVRGKWRSCGPAFASAERPEMFPDVKIVFPDDADDVIKPDNGAWQQ